MQEVLEFLNPALDNLKIPRLHVAGVNNSDLTVMSGETKSIEAAVKICEKESIRAKLLQVSQAFHSPLMKPILESFQVSFKKCKFKGTSNVDGSDFPKFFSTVTCEEMDITSLQDSSYWCKQIVQPVRFKDALLAATTGGVCSAAIEIGPDPQLCGMGKRVITDESAPIWIPSLKQASSGSLVKDMDTMLDAVASLVSSSPNQTRSIIGWNLFYKLENYQTKWIRGELPYSFHHSDSGREAAMQMSAASSGKTVSRNIPVQVVSASTVTSKNQTDAHEFTGESIVQTYYDAFAPEAEATDEELQRAMLTFGPFPDPILNFSWCGAFMEPKKRPYHWALVNNAQLIMRNLLFRHIEWEKTKHALDFGCGYGADLSRIAAAHRHLHLDGYTLSSHQQSIGNRLANYHKVTDRVHIYHRDSAKIEFPNKYELVFGFEVAHHVPDKPALFSNISRNIKSGGHLVLADFISNLHTSIDHHASSSFFVTKDTWVDLLSDNFFRITDIVDISPDVSNMLYDPDFEKNMRDINKLGFSSSLAQTEEEVIASFQSYDGLGRALGSGVASYVLIDATRDDSKLQSKSDYMNSLRTHNRSKIDNLLKLSQADPSSWPQRVEWIESKPNVEESAAEGGISSDVMYVVVGDGDSRQARKVRKDLNSAIGDDCNFQSSTVDGLKKIIGGFKGSNLQVIYMPEVVKGDAITSFLEINNDALQIISVLSDAGKSKSIRLWFISEGSSISFNKNDQNLQFSGLWGLGRVVALEKPNLNVTCVDISESLIVELGKEIIRNSKETVIKLSPTRLVGRLRHLPIAGWLEIPQIEFKADKIYIITGGNGGIGKELIPWMKSRGANKIVNWSRSGKDSGGVKSVKCDIEKLSDVENAMKESLKLFKSSEIGGVFHLAGVLKDCLLSKQSKSTFKVVGSPKVSGSWNLHEVTKTLKSLDHFVLFSSATACVGNVGQANYAAANSYMDALCSYRKSSNLPALSIGWSSWEGAGMGSISNIDSDIWPMKTSHALLALGKILSLHLNNTDLGDGRKLESHVVVASSNWSKLPSHLIELPYFSSKKPIMRKLNQNAAPARIAGGGAPSVNSSSLEELVVHLQKQAALLIGNDDDDEDGVGSTLPNPDSPFDEVGIDSLLTIELMNRINTDFNIKISPAAVMANPCIREVAKQIVISKGGEFSAGTSTSSHAAVKAKQSTVSSSSYKKSTPKPSSSKLIVSSDAHEFTGESIVQTYYDAFAPEAEATDEELQRAMLTFGPFPDPILNFSWCGAFMEPKKRPYHWALVNNAQLIMRNLLFRHIEWEKTKHALDFGCGYGADLSRIAAAHRHLHLDGYTLSSHQQSIGNRLANYHKVTDRVHIYHRDSAKIEFPNKYELVFGFEVAHHVPDKPALFSNISRNIKSGGHLVLADFISNLHTSIDHHASSSFFVTKDTWVDLLSDNFFRITDIVDISPDVSNMLYDPDFEKNMRDINKLGFSSSLAQTEEEVIASFQSYDGLGRALGSGVASYVLIDATRDDSKLQSKSDYMNSLRTHNRSKIDNLLKLSQADPSSWPQRVEWIESKPNVEESAAEGGISSDVMYVVVGDGDSRQARKVRKDLNSAIGDDCNFQSSTVDGLKKIIGGFKGSNLQVIYMPEVVKGDAITSFLEINNDALQIISVLSDAGKSKSIRLWFISEGSSISFNKNDQNLQFSGLWGLGRVVALEKPNLNVTCVDISESLIVELGKEIIRNSKETVIKLSPTRLVGRLRHLPIAGWLEIPQIEFKADKIYIITGGNGGIGKELIPWMKSRGANKIVNWSRSGKDSGGVKSVKCDIEKLSDVENAMKESLKLFKSSEIGGVFHLAGVLKDCLLSKQSKSTFKVVGSPKVSGSWNLHEVTKTLKSLDHFVLFSSATACVGNVGQANYAAANSYMDALCSYRKSSNLPALSIGWSSWEGAGMGSISNIDSDIWPMKTSHALLALGKILSLHLNNTDLGDGRKLESHVVVASSNWSKLPSHLIELPYFSSKKPIMRKLNQNAAPARIAGGGAPSVNSSSLEELVVHLQKQAALLIGNDDDDEDGVGSTLPNPDSPFDEVGIDSLLTIELMNRINTDFNIKISPAAVMANPCIREVAKQIVISKGENVNPVSSSSSPMKNSKSNSSSLTSKSTFSNFISAGGEGLAVEVEEVIVTPAPTTTGVVKEFEGADDVNFTSTDLDGILPSFDDCIFGTIDKFIFVANESWRKYLLIFLSFVLKFFRLIGIWNGNWSKSRIPSQVNDPTCSVKLFLEEALNSTIANGLTDDPSKNMAERAAALTTAACHLYVKTAEGFTFTSLDRSASQIKLFGRAKIPGEKADTLVHNSPPNGSKQCHIIIAKRGRFYRLDNVLALTPADLLSVFTYMLSSNVDSSPAEFPLGAMTHCKRREWFKVREAVISNVTNEESLSWIDSALFTISLDDDIIAGEDVTDTSPEMRRKSANRWYDHGFNIVVFKDGRAGICYCHAMTDGRIMMAASSWIASFGRKVNTQGKVKKNLSMPTPLPLISPSDEILQIVTKAEAEQVLPNNCALQFRHVRVSLFYQQHYFF